MARTSGTTVVGVQTLFVNQPRFVERLSLSLDQPIIDRPQKIGFLWLCQNNGDFDAYKQVVVSEPVWSAGNSVFIPEGLRYFSGRFTSYVEWNIAGVPWKCDF